jgi:hypothetical protein
MLDRSTALTLAAAVALACTESQPCPNPLEVCDGVCVDTNSDIDHCGTCTTACTPGLVCVGAVCVPGAEAPCDVRSGGAFVTLDVCGQAVKAWISDAAFIATAEGLVGSAPPPYPVFYVREGADCDGQWMWHVDATNAYFEDVAVVGRDACPYEIGIAKPEWLNQQWSPTRVAVLLVERMP